MPSRTAYAGTAVAGDVYTAANHAKMPGGWIGYAETVAAQGGITTEVDLAGLSVTVTVGSNRRIRVTADITLLPTGTTTQAYIKEGSTHLKRFAFINDSGSGLTTPALHQAGSVILTPTAGSHTYKLSADSGGLGASTSANSSDPHFILVEDLGPAT